MLIRIEGANSPSHAAIVDDMLKARAEVFHHRLHWRVTVENDREIDSYDSYDPLYLISVDDNTGIARGSLRLLPTSGPHMIETYSETSSPSRLFLRVRSYGNAPASASIRSGSGVGATDVLVTSPRSCSTESVKLRSRQA
jgi:hypothetical protein